MANRARTSIARGDADSRVPRYLQVATVLRRRIRDGHWSVGDRIATLEELEREFGVARVTVRQAIDLLHGEGLVQSFQGRGTFVTKAPENDRWIQLATDWESLIAPIRDNVPHVLAGGSDAPPRIEPGDGIPAPAYVHIRSVQKREGRIYAFARVHVAKHIHTRAPKLFASRVALAVLSEMEDLEISRAHQTLAIGAADMETARHLGIALNAPTAEARCVVTDDTGTVIYVGEITYPGDCVRLNIELIGPGRG
ncbi:MAG TPA: GntR family transcriptional regulator [Hyphomicrobiaceae bacterium]|nr:GntR family transcriptional regulator [Hyphomicrobiaceae bacterium]